VRVNGKEKVKKKVKESLAQTLIRLEVFLRIFPHLTLQEFKKIKFTTLSVLPVTLSKGLEICSKCSLTIVFREDIIPNCEQFGSLAKRLNSDMTQAFQSSNTNVASLMQKLRVKAETSNAPTNESLQILKSISAFLVGIGSLYIPKTYGKNKKFQEVAEGMLKEVNKRVKANLEKALYLSPEQVESMHSFNFAASGFYGTGKTTALEVAIDKIVENPAQFPHPWILFVTWDDSIELKEIFEEKFQKIREQNLPRFARSDNLEVLSMAEACDKYQVDHMPNRWVLSKDKLLSVIFKNRTKPDLLNDLCLKLQGEELKSILTLFQLGFVM
jgi:hypothetical protein